jgi:hypothetical protein
MTGAIFGLVGVMIGGLLTAGLETLARRGRERRVERLAARVLYDELASLRASARQSVKTQRPELMFSEKLELSSTWREHRKDLGNVEWDVWAAIDHAVASLETTTPAAGWSDERHDWLATVEEDAARAMDAVRPFVD